ncbi:hypothetical protein BMJ34_29650 [Sinorhizobium medicae]|uniref:DUF2867 domain-containing protein n=3 Tax=Sinorhizobium medicae TaxID=110321 RepID=A0ABX4TRW9_9HYPH|nr:DUF2867 domain-containing protein [Sinorhizobium medicae]MDX0519091.1 DUF2867 domain-containing protein [Sinorhizobium medicae]MDX0568578.1 DUF2867 domain-containing protein [Sinorhizobium medicae]MDX0581234.1 DUF2867 domain-containing protein [Sinorhizobium medicae]MDX0729494.1 DUF2867 domain-containing protein [Sinorhizobium medicae]
MRPRKAAARLPNAWLPGADWADRYEVLVLSERMTAAEAAGRAFGRAPRWVGNLLSFRNWLVPLVGLNATADTRNSDLVVSLPLMHSDDSKTVFGYDDHHLLFRLVVDVREGPADGQIVGITTLVRRRSLMGWLYLAAAIPFHKTIIPSLLTVVGQPGQNTPGRK